MAQLKDTKIEGILEITGKDANGKSLILPEGSKIYVGNSEFKGGGGGGGSADTEEIEELLKTKPGLIEKDENGNNLGEIFNTYEGEYKNQALGIASSAFGYGTTAGCKGYYIKSIDLDNKKIYLTETQVLPVISTEDNTDINFETPAYESGDLITISNQLLWVNCSAIDNIVNNVITYTTDLPFTAIENSDYADGTPYDTEEYSLLVLTKPTVGLNIIQIAGFAYGLQSISVGTGALAAGYNSIAFKYGDATGYQAIAGYAAHAEGKLTEAHRYGHAEGYGTKALLHAAHAEGRETIANGIQSHAEGRYSIANNDQAHAEGNSTEATGAYSHAEGYLTDATKTASHAEGRETTASGNFSHAEGRETTASGSASHAEGYITQANSTGAHSEGSNTIANKSGSHAEGYYTIASSNYQHVQGKYNIEDTDGIYAHIVGGGSSTTRKNIHTLDWQGNAYFAGGIESSHISAGRQADKTIGLHSLALGEEVEASGKYSCAIGHSAAASGQASHAEGYSITASGAYAHAEGQNNTASGDVSHVEGGFNRVKNTFSHAEGTMNEITGSTSHAEGQGHIVESAQQHVQGKYSITDTENKYAHIVGNGTSTSSKSNAHTLDWNGNAWYKGSITSNGGDYAEYFEWIDGNLNNEDRVGYMVALDGEKIRFANMGDEVLGIVSGTVAVLGDNYECEWNGKYLTDDFGRVIYDSVEEFVNKIVGEDEEGNPIIEKQSLGFFKHPRLNPEYDPEQTYVNRADRPEWDAVGMLGKLYIRDDGTCIPNFYATAGINGVATSSLEKTNMRVLSRVNDNIIRVLLK